MKVVAVAALTLLVAGCTGDADAVDPTEATLSVRADGCGPRQGIGTATLVGDDVAITAAHVVAGSDEVVVRDVSGTDHPAEVIAFDPDLDVALLAVPDGLGALVPLTDDRVEAGDDAIATVLRDDVALRLDVEILRRANVETTDIYLADAVTRPGFEIRADIEPGDSGTTLIVNDAIAGVVWSRSVERSGRAWVVAVPASIADAIDQDERAAVDTGSCT